ncbi:MAG: leucine-rich repeat domain-containing protein [Clostridiales bacterium]|jgi:tetratricopeptide (TPR) repeat protein|nr:leucine-rich repeat domain-containing protein [Clostridiales bacterium]
MKKKILIALIIAVLAGGGIAGAILYRGQAVQAINSTPLDLGEKYLADLNYAQATVAFERAIAVEPNIAEAYLALAKAYQYMGDQENARVTLETGQEKTNSSVIKRVIANLDAQTPTPVPKSSPAVAYVAIGGASYPVDAVELDLREMGLKDADLEKLKEFKSLERLDISRNEITDVTALGEIKSLERLFASYNQIKDVTPLGSLDNLEYVSLRANQIEKADPLLGLGKIKYLHLSENKITDLPSVGDSLLLLYLAGNSMQNTDSITGKSLLHLDVSGNPASAGRG